jgi:K+-transporting ATPase KdpF subunit
MSGCVIAPEDHAMTLHLWLAGLTVLALIIYLVAVLIQPERF